jgi:hypothetical protein
MYNIQFADSLPKEPHGLSKLGYIRSEEWSTDSDRWVLFTKTIRSFPWSEFLNHSAKCEIAYELAITHKFELVIHDDPTVSTVDNFEYSYNDSYMRIYRNSIDGERASPSWSQSFRLCQRH